MRSTGIFTSIAILLATCLQSVAQEPAEPLHAQLYNKEYDVFLNIDMKTGMSIPGHELYGLLPGYLGITTSTFYWLVIEAETNGKDTRMQLVNDYGSEDLEAVLEQKNDTTFILKQGKGSSIKLPKNRKWMKLPGNLEFILKR